MSEQYISQIERGSRVPPLPIAIALHDVLRPETPLEVWLLEWLRAKVGHLPGPAQRGAPDAVARALSELDASRRGRSNEHLSLADFPDAFLPLTVICGDRREATPQTPADIFVYSVAVTDLMFFPRLRIKDPLVTIKSDKQFLLMDEVFLKEHFGRTNLLVIGSPAVNLAARKLNHYAIFRVDYPGVVRRWEKTYLEQIDLSKRDNLTNMMNLAVFWKMVQFIERRRAREDSPEAAPFALEPEDLPSFEKLLSADEQAKFDRDKLAELADVLKTLVMEEGPAHVMNEFRKPGLVDPADRVRHGKTTRPNNDFGFISLAPNPFSDPADGSYVSVLVSGIHGPATAHALRALAEGDFTKHPYGGVIEVTLDQFKDWPTRFQEAVWEWQTKDYTPQSLLRNLETALDEPVDAFENLYPHDIEALIDFVRSLSGTGIDLTPSPTVPTAGGNGDLAQASRP
jgi:hypothetical protein